MTIFSNEKEEEDNLEKYFDKLQILNQSVWENICNRPQIVKWLQQFTGSIISEKQEQKYMIFALSKFMYFSQRMVREMLISLYRDLIRAPIIQKIRRDNNNTTNYKLLSDLYSDSLNSTRFIGVGNPAESGAHLLYIFRQVNNLEKKLFCDLHGAFDIEVKSNENISSWKARDEDIKKYIFFDDFVGGGTQASRYLEKPIASIRKRYPDVELLFISLFATSHGLNKLNEENLFNGKALCLFELDDTFKSCSLGARYFDKSPSWFSLDTFRNIATHYGSSLYEQPLGHGDCELLLSFSHNTPNNTLPIFWKNSSTNGVVAHWYPVFERFDKNYGLPRGVK